MRKRRFFLFSALLVTLLTVTAIAGSYQLTKNGKTLVWRDDDKSGVEVTWSGKRDPDGYATGYGTLTWYAPEDTLETGSNIPRTRYKVSSRVSGTMVRGKFADASGRATAQDSHEPAKPERKGWLSRIFKFASKPTPAPAEATPKPQRKSASPHTEETPEPNPMPAEPTAKPTPASTRSPSAAESLSESMNAPSSLKLSSPAASVSPNPDVSLQPPQTTSPSPTPQ